MDEIDSGEWLMFKKIYNWYMKTFLPFEDPSHPLHHSNYKKPKCPIEQMIDDHYDAEDLIGPNYSQHFYKPTEYEKWGNKWYKKG